jgi:hypothetical protein
MDVSGLFLASAALSPQEQSEIPMWHKEEVGWVGPRPHFFLSRAVSNGMKIVQKRIGPRCWTFTNAGQKADLPMTQHGTAGCPAR